ncbi:MAG TPA: FAD-binding oxidoreductase [Gaiellaceae bacterium]|nr:FAD-binding oxidoreductase [Gaiellaceae bacterium]
MRSAEVVVVGAGVTGLSVALQLAERGVGPVLVLERDGVAAGQSGVQPGGVRLQWGTELNCRMALEARGFWREAEARLEPREPFGWRACGYLWLAHSAPVLERLRAGVALQNRLGIRSRIVSPAEVAELVPGLVAEALAGASWCGEDGYFDRPQGVVEAFADAAVRAGAGIEHTEVTAVEPGGVVAGGDRIAAGHVVVAAGVGTPALFEPLGVEVPIVAEDRFMLYSEPIRERLVEPLVVSAERHFAAKQLGNGRVLSSDLSARGDPAAGEPGWRAHVRATIRELLPQLEYVEFPVLAAGTYDVTPDHQAILGAAPGLDGVWIAAGFSGHGFMMSPVAGRLIAGAIAGDPPDDYLRAFSLERFARGELIPEPAIV